MMVVISPSQTGFLMEVKLIVVAGKSAQKSIPLKLPTIIGRSHEAGVTVNHPMVSRQHAELFEADGLLMIRDLGSLNGTVVGDQRIKESPLPPDANFTVGPLTFQVQYAYNGDLGALPAPVLAEKPTTDSRETEPLPKSPGELTDNKMVKTIVTKPIGKKSDETRPVSTKPAQQPPKESSGDPFDDMLNELL
jgi:pSer/pThr/pTyr-binding forkhead associated (FHA) protein